MLEILHGPVQVIAYPMLFQGVIVPGLLTGMLLGISAIKARVLPKSPAFFTLAVLFLLILGKFIPLPLFDHVFALVHLVFIWFGAVLAFETKQALQVPVQGIQA